MKHKILKNAAIIMALLIAGLSLAGCGNAVTPQKEAVISNGSPVKLNGDAIYPIECDDTLTFWFTATAVWESKYSNYADTPVGQELKKQTGVNIEYIHPSGGQGTEQFQILLAANELPDIVNNNWYSYPGGPEVAIEDDYIYRLNDIIDEYCPAFSKMLSEHPDWAKDMKTDEGSLYAFLQVTEGDPMPSTFGPIIRADWLEKVNMEIPRNIGEWEKVLTAFKDELGVKYPYCAQKTAMTQNFGPAFGFFPGWYLDDGNVKYGQATPEYKDFLVTINRWYKNGLIHPDFITVDSKQNQSDILNGKTGSTIGWMGSGLGQLLEAGKSVEGFDLVAAPYPAMGNGTGTAEYGYGSNRVSTGDTTAISRNCKNVELAARFLDFGYTEAGDAVYNFGVEGESYNWVEKDGEKYPQFTDLVYKNPEGLTTSEVLHMYTRAAHSNVPMITDPRFTEQFYPFQQQKDALKVWADTNMAQHVIPVVYMTPEQSDEVGTIMANVNTYIDEMTIKFITGAEPIENYDTYMQTLKDFGIEKVIAFRQEALDRYNSR